MSQSDHEFIVGDEVLVRFPGGSLRAGHITEIKILKSLSAPITLYRVTLRDDGSKGLYELKDLIWADDPDRLIVDRDYYLCSCGASKTHFPNKAPGHAYYCKRSGTSY